MVCWVKFYLQIYPSYFFPTTPPLFSHVLLHLHYRPNHLALFRRPPQLTTPPPEAGGDVSPAFLSLPFSLLRLPLPLFAAAQSRFRERHRPLPVSGTPLVSTAPPRRRRLPHRWQTSSTTRSFLCFPSLPLTCSAPFLLPSIGHRRQQRRRPIFSLSPRADHLDPT